MGYSDPAFAFSNCQPGNEYGPKDVRSITAGQLVSSPHTRGVSVGHLEGLINDESSPHQRGCFRHVPHQVRRPAVFSAHAGVFPTTTEAPVASLPLPRTSRGCFLLDPAVWLLLRVFPAHAGVFPTPSTSSRCCTWSSPHPRGCFHLHRGRPAQRREFPAAAGVFARPARGRNLRRCIPRTRGGVSSATLRRLRIHGSSPYARGCFLGGSLQRLAFWVFPAVSVRA